MYQFASKRNPGGIIRMPSERGAERLRRQGFAEITPEPEPVDEDIEAGGEDG